MAGSGETNDRFGWSLAAGDFNGDGKDDLAVGAPYEDLTGGDDAGTVHVFPGGSLGLVPGGDPGLSPSSTGVCGGAQAGDRFGWSLAAGDFNGDGKDDLAIGGPGEDLGHGAGDDAGVVNVLYGTATSTSSAAVLTTSRDQLWFQGY